MVKAYFTACEQAFPAQRAQLRRLALALGRGGVERMEQLCAMQRAGPEELLELRSIGAKSLPLIAAICAQYEANRTPSQGGTPLRETGMPSCRRRRRNPMTRRLLSMFCALALCLSLLPGTALAAEEVSYLAYSWNGSELTSETESVSDYTTVATSTTTWSDGWYVVSGTVNVGDLRNTTVTVNGIVNLILTAGSNVNLTYGTISINDGGTLNIYGQEGSSGTLTLAGNRGSTNSGIVLGSGSALNIHGGTVTATGYCTNATSPAPGIDVGGSGTLTVYGGEVTAEAGTYNGAGIRVTSSGTVSIYGGTVTATGASNKSANGYPGAGIGGNGGSSAGETCGTVNIYGGTVTATGGSGGSGASAGIGGGQGGKTNNQGGGGNVTITGGTVTATGGKNSTGAVQAPGIGGAVYSSSQGNAGSFSTGTNGSAVITTTGGIQAGTSGCSAIIDNKVYGNVTLPDSQLSSKNLTVTNGATLTISGEKTLSSSITVNDGGTLTVSGTVTNSGTITVESGGTLTGTGTIHNTDSGKVTNNGTNDTVTITYPSTVTVTSDKDGNTAAPGTQVEFTATVSGTAGTPTGTVTFKDGDASLGSEELDDTGKATYTVSTSDDLDIGEHTITAEYTPAGDAAYTESSGSLTFTVVGDVASIKIKTPPTTMTYTTGQALDLTGLEITVSYAGSSYKQDITWSADSGITAKIDNVEVDNNTVLSASQHNGKAVTITYEGQSAQTSALSVSKANQTGFAFTEESPETVTYGDEPFTVEAIGGQSTGEVTYTVNEGGGDVVNVNSTSGEVTILKAGTATITATKAADGDYNAATDTLEVTVNSKSLENAQVNVTGSYTYNGSEIMPDSGNVTVTLDDKTLTSDDYTLSYSSNTDAGEATVTAAGKGNYSGTATGHFTINQATPTVTGVQVSGTGIIYDTTDISAITLTHGADDTPGTVKLDDGQTLTVGEGSYRWTFTPTDTTNYTTATGSITLTVAVDTVQSITVSTAPTKTTYTYGDSFDKTGMVVTATYASGATKDVTEDVTITPTELTVDVTTVTISYGGQTTTHGITVNPKEISITSATVQDKTYDGNTTATVESVDFTGLVNGESLTSGTDYTATAAFDNADAGDSKQATVTVTLKNGNYTFGSNSDTYNATAAIQKAALTVTAPSKTITVGDTIPDLSTLQATVTGLVGEDTFSGVTLAYEGTPDSNTPGTWAIKPSGGSLTTGNTNNYTVSYANGTLTVEKKPVSGGGTSGGTTTPSGPSIGGSDGWTEIEDEVDETPSGSTVTVDMNGTTEVPAEVFEAVAGKDVTLELDMGGGVKWEINGQDIPADADLTDLDLGVTMNTSDIPVDVINAVTGDKEAVQLTLAHNGEFGFTLTLTAPVGVQNKGLWANLYHYNTTLKQMLFETSAQVDASGNVALKFTHASEYAIVLDESSHELPFTDVGKKSWYTAAVQYVYQHGIMTGTGATAFEPNTTLSRAMVAQILYNLEGQPAVTEATTFTDSGTHWAAKAIAWAQETGVVNGYEDNTFRPNRAVSREELAQMLYNYAKYKEITLPALGDLSKFPDGDKVSSWARTAMSWATGLQVIGGYEDTTLRPGGSTTRAEAASMILGLATKLVSIPA